MNPKAQNRVSGLQAISNCKATEKHQSDNPLGKNIHHAAHYDPGHLYPIPRMAGRQIIGSELPLFLGVDIWNAYEVSWLAPRGKPCVAMAQITFSATTKNLIESKSLKLYLFTFNQTIFASPNKVKQTIQKDLESIAKGRVKVELMLSSDFRASKISQPRGECIDDLEVDFDCYTINRRFLKSAGSSVNEKLYSQLLRTTCPITCQPDWATIEIEYTGPRIERSGLLKYIVSFRQEKGFHEQCVEQIYTDIWRHCSPRELTVEAHFTRRGGIDINPYRSNRKGNIHHRRLAQQ